MFLVLNGLRLNVNHIINYYTEGKVVVVVTTNNKHRIEMEVKELDQLLREMYLTVKGRE